MALLILLGVSVIIYALARSMPNDFVDINYSSAVAQGTMKQEDVDRIKELYGLNMPDAFLTVGFDDGQWSGELTKSTREDVHDDVVLGATTYVEWYSGSFDSADGSRRLYLDTEDDSRTYRFYKIESSGELDFEGEDENSTVTISEVRTLLHSGTFAVDESGTLTLSGTSADGGGAVSLTAAVNYRKATVWEKIGAVLGGYFNWLGNLFKGDLGVSFKYKRPVGEVIFENMGISFMIMFIATVLEFAIAIPLGIKAATHQYGVVDYTVTVLTMMGISLPTFFLAAVFIRVFAVQLGWFEVNGLRSASLAMDASWLTRLGDMAWHLVLPMTVLVILSVGSLMRYTRTNMLEVMNSDYIRTARAKGLSEHTVVYKHAFRNTMVPLVTMMAGILPSLFGGAMITETVFAIPGIGKMAYDALVASDVTFIMGYNMFLAVLTVIGTLLSDLMYAVVDPRVKLGK